MKRYRFITVFIFAFSVVACRKSKNSSSDKFDAASAKEWYYGVFKKSSEWLTSDLRGKKLPDWDHDVYRKNGNMELVEFPLVSFKKLVPITNLPVILQSDQLRIVGASLNRILFIRKPNEKTVVRELIYVPDIEYLRRKGFDISDCSTLSDENDFCGRLIIKNWKGDILNRWMIRDGKVIARGTVKREKPATDNLLGAMQECTLVEICEYEQICTEYWQGDEFLGEHCEPWMQTGNCWFEEYCNEESCDPGGNYDECMCSFYGICDNGDGDGGGEDGENEDCEYAPAQVLAGGMPVSDEISSATDQEVVNQGVTRRKWNSTWTFWKGSFLTYKWSYISYDEGTHIKEGNLWKWETLNHTGHSQQGISPFKTTCTVHQAVPNISADKLIGEMKLYYSVQTCIECKGYNLGCDSKSDNSEKWWRCNP